MLDGKLADSALAEFAQQPSRQAPAHRLDSHLADQALADLSWSPPPRTPQKQSSAFPGLQDGLRDVPLATGRRTASKDSSMRQPDLTSVLADLKNDALVRAGRKPQPHTVTRLIETKSAPKTVQPNTSLIAAPPPPVATALPPQRRTAPPPQRATTGVLTGLRLLPPDQPIRRDTPAIAAVAVPVASQIVPKATALLQSRADNPAVEPSAPITPAAPAPNARIVIEVLPPPAPVSPAAASTQTATDNPTTAPPSTGQAATVTGVLTGLRLLPAAAPPAITRRTLNQPPQAFRSSQPPDKIPLFITARSGETVKIVPAEVALPVSKALADDALAAYTAVTPRGQTQQPLHFSELDLNLAVSPPEESKTGETPQAPDPPATSKPTAAAAGSPDMKQTDRENDDNVLKKKAPEANADTVPLTAENAVTDLRQELWKEWSEKVILLEQENKALRGELAQTKADPLQDIRVDAVAKIKEQVLRERIIELEKEVLEAQNKAREAALNEAAKKAADSALAPPPGAKDLPIKP